MASESKVKDPLQSPESFLNRELSWLNFARRVVSLIEDQDVPLLERVKFTGIIGMLHDEFFMKRMSGLKRQIKRKVKKYSLDGRKPIEEFEECRKEILRQSVDLSRILRKEIRPGLEAAGIPILDYAKLDKAVKKDLRDYLVKSVLPILTPLAVDAEHPFPFISNLGLNLAVEFKEKRRERFVRVKVPANRNRWVPIQGGGGFVPIEQIIAANLDCLFPQEKKLKASLFRVTRGAEGESGSHHAMDDSGTPLIPGSIISHVTNELKARKFAGEVRLQVSGDMSEGLLKWLTQQLKVGPEDVYRTDHFIGIADLLSFQVEGHEELRDPPHRPVTHPRLRDLEPGDHRAIFQEIRRGDILLHHPYHSFDTSVQRFIESASVDPKVLAIKLTIYRTSKDSPIVQALADAARRGLQVAVLVEITARFDEAPNIAWGRYLEKEGVHVSYGVEKFKTHVKLALVVREEDDGIKQYVHVGTGNYHSGTARVYEDVGVLSADPDLAADVAAVFNELTSATPYQGYNKLLVAPWEMRKRFTELIRRETANAAKGKPAGIKAKMNQLQDPDIIRELYKASMAGVPIDLYVRGLCCMRAGIPGLSETVHICSIVGRFLEHGRVYRFENAGSPEFYLGSADWMKRNLDRRMETITPIEDSKLQQELEEMFAVYSRDNCCAWDQQPDGTYVRRRPAKGEELRPSQQMFIMRSLES